MSERVLPVTLHEQLLGHLTADGAGRALMVWSDPALWRQNSAVLSRHLRVGVSSVESTESFFGGLLPEGIHRDRLATAVQTSSTDLVGLFAAVGADLAGALRIGSPREAGEPQRLSAAEVRELLAQAQGFLVGGGGSALPGFQRKLTLTRDDGGWMRGNGQIASTHILKPIAAEYRAAVEGEAYALAIARELGLASFEAWVDELDDLAVLVVERYDRRRTASGTVERLHQEDCAQALGLPSGGDHKFEWHEPRASLATIANELDDDATVFAPGTDRERLLRYVTLTVALGNTDAHAKNYSLLHDERGGTRLAPLYDIAPLALRYDAGTALAMSINRVVQQPDVTVDDLVAEAEAWGLTSGRAREIVLETLDGIVTATRMIVAHASIEKHVPGYVRGQAENLLAGNRARIESHLPLMLLPGVGTPGPTAQNTPVASAGSSADSAP